MTELDTLRELVFNNGFDEESRKDVLQWEQRLHELSVKENLLQYPIVKEWFDWMQREVSQARILLSSDPTLTDNQRTELFIRMEIANRFLSLLDISDREKAEESIKKAVDVAKAQISS